MNLQSIIEKTLTDSLPAMIQARVKASLTAVNPAIDEAIAKALANVLGGNPQRVVAAPVAKPSSEVKVKVKARATPKAKPAKKPAKAPKAKAKPVAPDVDHKELTRSSRCVKADRRWMVLPSGAVYDIATRKPGKRKGKAVRATLVCGQRAEADMAELERFGFRTRSIRGTNPCAAPCGRPCAFAPNTDLITASMFKY